VVDVSLRSCGVGWTPGPAASLTRSVLVDRRLPAAGRQHGQHIAAIGQRLRRAQLPGAKPLKAKTIARELLDHSPGFPPGSGTVNGQPGLVAQQDGLTVTVFAFEVAGGQITHIWAVRNPGKLRPWTTG
jgi:hypothetical protein